MPKFPSWEGVAQGALNEWEAAMGNVVPEEEQYARFRSMGSEDFDRISEMHGVQGAVEYIKSMVALGDRIGRG